MVLCPRCGHMYDLTKFTACPKCGLIYTDDWKGKTFPRRPMSIGPQEEQTSDGMPFGLVLVIIVGWMVAFLFLATGALGMYYLFFAYGFLLAIDGLLMIGGLNFARRLGELLWVIMAVIGLDGDASGYPGFLVMVPLGLGGAAYLHSRPAKEYTE